MSVEVLVDLDVTFQITKLMQMNHLANPNMADLRISRNARS